MKNVKRIIGFLIAFTIVIATLPGVQAAATGAAVKDLEVPWQQSQIGFTAVEDDCVVQYDTVAYDDFELVIGQINRGDENGPTVDIKVWTITNDAKVRVFSGLDFFQGELWDTFLNDGLKQDGSNISIRIEEGYCSEKEAAIGLWVDDDWGIIRYTVDGVNFSDVSTEEEPEEDLPSLTPDQFGVADEYTKVELVGCYNGLYVLACRSQLDPEVENMYCSDYYIGKEISYDLAQWHYLGYEDIGAGSWQFDFYEGEKGLFITQKLSAMTPDEEYVMYTKDGENLTYIGYKPGKEPAGDAGFMAWFTQIKGKAYVFECDLSYGGDYYGIHFSGQRVIEFNEDTQTAKTVYSADNLKFENFWWVLTSFNEIIIRRNTREVLHIMTDTGEVKTGTLAYDPGDISYYSVVKDTEDDTGLHQNYDIVGGEIYFSCDYFKTTRKILIPANAEASVVFLAEDNIYILGKSSYQVGAEIVDCLAKDLPLPSCKNHSFSDWNTTATATCTTAGEQSRKCTVCGHIEKQTVDPLGHEFSSPTVTKQPSCTEPGIESKACTRCTHIATTEIKATGHTLGNWKNVKAATCAEEGTQERTCSSCNYKESRKTEKVGHSFEAPVVIKEPSLTSAGLMEGTCKWCNESTKQEIPCSAKDKTTGTEFETAEGVFQKGTEMKVVEILENMPEYETIQTALSELTEKFVAYDISAVLNNAKVQPNGTVKVTFQIPANFSDNVALFFVADDGAKERVDSTINDDGTLSALLLHFSSYVLCDLDAIPTNTNPSTDPSTVPSTDPSTETTIPATAPTGVGSNEKENNNATIFIVIGIIVLIAVAGGVTFILIRKKQGRTIIFW